ncbi:hypothetical protein [Ancylobacter pratisalsi]|uniref:DUF4114 domain-containing protein n=1 Tax=Ancylobacter pratisalsi TaxID=1745854 RepID=A0A6P1YK11_9HYPH|nr:hypothetical protein [Ancylobacter pratisalsi]QIB33727.1 hypothetical protein G3A50_08435 [Ancylobacter pratisalsi]
MTTTTELKITLTDELQDTLNAGGAAVYAIYFNPTSGAPVIQTLFTGATSAGPATAPITVDVPLTLDVVSGKVYFLVQSPVDGTLADPTTFVGTQSDLNWQSAETHNYRYDSFELTIENNINDAGNLSSVEGYGLPMSVGVSYGDGSSASVGYNVSGNELFHALSTMGQAQTVFPYATTAGEPGLTGDRAGLSPSQSVGIKSAAFTAGDWDSYVDYLKKIDPQTHEPNANAIQFAGFFDGAKDANGVYHNGGFYAYVLEWDENNGIFWLSPTDDSQVRGYIAITPEQLAGNIYATEGYVEIYESKSDYASGDAYHIYLNTYTYIDSSGKSVTNDDFMDAAANNQWGDILKDLFTGFTAGFYGMTGVDAQGGQVDLDQNWNWDPTYSFGANLATGEAPIYYDPYSAYFFANSNSYGSGYSDQLMSQYSEGGPLISLYDPSLGGSVTSIAITIFDDDETPTGYTKPVIYNYIAPGADGYTPPEYDANSAANIVLNFANSAMILDETVARITFSFQTGDASHPWASVTIDGSMGSLWQNWDIVQEKDGSYSAVPQNPAGMQPAGTILIGKLPVADDGVSHYKIEVGANDGHASKTFNLYTTTNADGLFLDPAYAGQAGAIAIDGLATVSAAPATQYVNTFTIDFLPSTTTTIDPSLLTRVQSTLVPSSVVVGQVTGTDPSPSPHGGGFTALAGQDALNGNVVSSQHAQLGFGWTGLNNATAASASWISGYTNKVDGQSVALVTIAGAGLAPVALLADIDGQWVSQGKSEIATLGEGTYTVTMQQYAASDTAHAHPLTQVSSKMTLTIALNEMDLVLAPGGAGAQLVDDGSGTSGNWIRLETSGAALEAGSSLVAYAVNANGEMVSRDGLEAGASVTLQDATLGHIGAIAGDDGSSLMFGGQSVHLGAGLELRFAEIDASGHADLSPAMNVSATPDGGIQFALDGFVLQASVENSLDAAAMIAGNQRASDTPWVYLEHGDLIQFEIAGSSANTNTLGFVRIDVDPATGDWSVGGVAYGDTDAFHDAVRGALDDGFLYQQGGNFQVTDEWEVAGASGYYAPVLLTQDGETFVIGNANDGGNDYIRMFGENTFGIEDLTASAGSDFDYNDMVVRLLPSEELLS